MGGNVGELRTAQYDVADRVDLPIRGAQQPVDADAAWLVDDAGGIKSEAVDIR